MTDDAPTPRDPSIEEKTALVVATVAEDPVAVFTQPERYAKFISDLRGVIAQANFNVETKTGREAIKSLAFKVTRSKTALDNTRKSLTEEWRKQTNMVNETGKKMTAELEAIAEEVRRPVTEWEAEEKRRAAVTQEYIDQLHSCRNIASTESSADLEKRGRELHDLVLPAELYGDRLQEAEEVKAESVRLLAQAMHTKRDQEAQAAELEQLRKEKAERDAQDAKRREQEESIEAKRRAAQTMLDHISSCRAGTIGNQPQPYGILLYELETKIPNLRGPEADYGDLVDHVESARVEAIAYLKQVAEEEGRNNEIRVAEERKRREEAVAEESRQKAIREQEAKAAADRAEEEKRLRNKRLRAQIKSAISTDIFNAAEITPEAAASVADAIMAGKVRFVALKAEGPEAML